MMTSNRHVLALALLAALASSASLGASPSLASLQDGFVGCSTSDNAFPFDLSTLATGPTINLLPEGDYPYDATIRPDGSEVWFVGAVGDGAVVIDRTTNSVTHRIATGDYPTSIAFSADGALALVSCRDTEELTLIDTGTYQVIGSLPLPTGFDGGNIALDPVSGRFYVVDWYDNTIFEIAPDGSAILDQVDIGTSLWQIVVAPDGTKVYVTDRGQDVVRVIDRETLTEVQSVTVGDDPWGLDVTLDGTRLVVTCEDSHDAYVIDTSTWMTVQIPLDPTADPRDVDILDAQATAFVTGGVVGATDDRVYLIDLSDNVVADYFDGPGTNTNVIAVQAQMGIDPAAVAEALPGGPVLRVVPNPSGGPCEIHYSLSGESTVRLALFDAGGRFLRRLEPGRQAAGSHRAALPTDGLPGGVYFVRLTAGREGAAGRLVLR